ncbi:MAG TPA: alpha/beta hydrolase, partial [Anaerolineales bacterium]|nr:alpha/beta hydrolase [Anaerolineales bacterium]
YSLFLNCKGTGRPTVILDSGLDSDSNAWLTVMPRVQGSARICAYDRAGLGRSDPAPKTPRTSMDMVVDLHTLLNNAHLGGGYVLVGASIAGFNALLYTNQYPQEVVGIVLVDASHPDQFARLLAALPPQSPDESTELKDLRNSLSVPIQSIEGMDVETSAEQVRATGSLGNLPLTVLTAGSPSLSEIDIGLGEVWLEMQMELAGLSANSAHIVVPDATHCIQCDAPEAVADAILNVVNSAR